ncbi:hypothetical protein B0H13DRAFT_2275288 [Mycena leptocephala]|nr:hypothetical protein B0H13DRAFT_2275288 [Mycena leptocephala]
MIRMPAGDLEPEVIDSINSCASLVISARVRLAAAANHTSETQLEGWEARAQHRIGRLVAWIMTPESQPKCLSGGCRILRLLFGPQIGNFLSEFDPGFPEGEFLSEIDTRPRVFFWPHRNARPKHLPPFKCIKYFFIRIGNYVGQAFGLSFRGSHDTHEIHWLAGAETGLLRT